MKISIESFEVRINGVPRKKIQGMGERVLGFPLRPFCSFAIFWPEHVHFRFCPRWWQSHHRLQKTSICRGSCCCDWWQRRGIAKAPQKVHHPVSSLRIARSVDDGSMIDWLIHRQMNKCAKNSLLFLRYFFGIIWIKGIVKDRTINGPKSLSKSDQSVFCPFLIQKIHSHGLYLLASKYRNRDPYPSAQPLKILKVHQWQQSHPPPLCW